MANIKVMHNDISFVKVYWTYDRQFNNKWICFSIDVFHIHNIIECGILINESGTMAMYILFHGDMYQLKDSLIILAFGILVFEIYQS